VYETKIHNIADLRKCLMQTWFDFDQYTIDTAVDHWHDHLRSCVLAGGGHFDDMNVHFYGSPEHFMKLSM